MEQHSGKLIIYREYLGLELTRYKSGNISSAKFNGETISNSEARRLEGTKCYVDVATKEVVCDREDLKQAAQGVIDDALSKDKSPVLAQAETKKAAPKDDFKLANGYRTESGRPLKEADKDEFIIKPDGSKDFGTIDEHIEKATNGILKAGKIRLRVGWDNGGKGSGLFHAKYHEKDAQNMGYRSIEDLISDVGSSFDAVYVRKATQQGLHDTYVLVKYPNKDQNGRGASIPIYFELQPDGNSYNIITAIPKGQRSLTRELKKEHLIYSDQANQSTATPNSSSVSDLSDNNVGDGQDSMPASAKSNVLSTSIIPQEVKKGKKHSVREANGQLTRSKEDLKAEIKEAFPNAKEIKDEGERMTFTMPNGSHIVVDLKNEILLTGKELAQAKKDHHIDDNGNVVVEGYAEARGKDAYIALAQGSREGTGFHEAYHIAEDAVLTDREKAAIKKAIPDAEGRADKYAEWVEARKHGRGTAWGKLFQKIKDFAMKMKTIFTGAENVHNVFRKIESGEVWERTPTNGQTGKYSLNRKKLYDAIRRWNNLCDYYEKSDKQLWKKKHNGDLYKLMDMPLILEAISNQNMELSVYGSFFGHALKEEHHGMTLDIIRQLPAAMAEPMMILQSENGKNKFVFVLDVKDSDGATVIVPVELEKIDKNHGIINVANSAYGKTRRDGIIPNDEWFIKNIDEGNPLYVDTKKKRGPRSIRGVFPCGFRGNPRFI